MHDAVESVLAERRGRSLARLRTIGLVGAAVFHAALATAAVVVPNLGREERQPFEFVNVQVVPASALGRPQPPAPQPRPPEPETEVAEAAPEPAPPEPEPEPELQPEPVRQEPPRRQRDEPADDRPENRQPATAAPTRPGSPQGTAVGTSTLGQVMVGDPSFTYGYYLDRVLAAIERQWRRPPTDGAPLEVLLTFRIGRDGRVSELEVAEPSGLTAFDLAGLRAVQTASPLPPLPAGYRNDSLSVRLIVR